MEQGNEIGLEAGALSRVTEELSCLICLETVQLPVNFICFRGCGGNFTVGGSCLRGMVCLHCANVALQLGRPAQGRFPDSGGHARCLICRESRVDARALTPDAAYLLNYNVMAVMDALRLGAACRACDLDFPTQIELQQHYARRCPAAAVRCRFRGCAHWEARSAMADHEECCPVGRGRCSQCGAWVDRSELLRHMVTACRQRLVHCMLCKHSARLPDMLQHLKLHQTQLQGHMQGQARATGPAAGVGVPSKFCRPLHVVAALQLRAAEQLSRAPLSHGAQAEAAADTAVNGRAGEVAVRGWQSPGSAAYSPQVAGSEVALGSLASQSPPPQPLHPPPQSGQQAPGPTEQPQTSRARGQVSPVPREEATREQLQQRLQALFEQAQAAQRLMASRLVPLPPAGEQQGVAAATHEAQPQPSRLLPSQSHTSQQASPQQQQPPQVSTPASQQLETRQSMQLQSPSQAQQPQGYVGQQQRPEHRFQVHGAGTLAAAAPAMQGARRASDAGGVSIRGAAIALSGGRSSHGGVWTHADHPHPIPLLPSPAAGNPEAPRVGAGPQGAAASAHSGRASRGNSDVASGLSASRAPTASAAGPQDGHAAAPSGGVSSTQALQLGHFVSAGFVASAGMRQSAPSLGAWPAGMEPVWVAASAAASPRRRTSVSASGTPTAVHAPGSQRRSHDAQALPSEGRVHASQGEEAPQRQASMHRLQAHSEERPTVLTSPQHPEVQDVPVHGTGALPLPVPLWSTSALYGQSAAGGAARAPLPHTAPAAAPRHPAVEASGLDAEEHSRLIRAAAAILRASASASERRLSRHSSASSNHGGCRGGSVSGAQPHAGAASGAGNGTRAQAASGVAAAPAAAPMESQASRRGAIRRSFSDTELVFDALEELVKESMAAAEQRGAARVSVSCL